VRLARPAAGRLLLEADGCALQQREPSDGELRCWAFQVRGLRLARVELYDVTRDPAQRQDLARQRPRQMRSLLRDLLAFQPRPAAPEIAAPPLDPELESQLKALGYLQ
jgi:hypothetical protein